MHGILGSLPKPESYLQSSVRKANCLETHGSTFPRFNILLYASIIRIQHTTSQSNAVDLGCNIICDIYPETMLESPQKTQDQSTIPLLIHKLNRLLFGLINYLSKH